MIPPLSSYRLFKLQLGFREYSSCNTFMQGREYLQNNVPVCTNLNIKYYYVEATALSLLVNRYLLRQKRSDVSNCGVDSTLVYASYIDSTGSFLHKYS